MRAARPTVRAYPVAKSDCIAAWNLLADKSTDLADAVLDLLDNELHRLARTPAAGQERFDLAPTLRCYYVETFRVFYRPVAGGIEIVRLLHEACDPSDGDC